MTTKDQGGKDIGKQTIRSRPPQLTEGEEALARQTIPSAAFKRTAAGGHAPLKQEDVLAMQAIVGNMSVQRLLAQRQEAPKTEAEITEEKLNNNGITIESSGNCRDKTNKKCTSVDGMRAATVDGIIAFRNAVGIDLVMTGGTETGHAGGAHSHAKGYKVDIRLDAAVTQYIKDNFTSKGSRRDGADLYEDSEGNVYAKEGNHWDITYK